MGFPKISEELLKEAKAMAMADLWCVTLCKSCKFENYGMRIGCECGGDVEWLYRTNDNRYLREGVDVCAIPVR